MGYVRQHRDWFLDNKRTILTCRNAPPRPRSGLRSHGRTPIAWADKGQTQPGSMDCYCNTGPSAREPICIIESAFPARAIGLCVPMGRVQALLLSQGPQEAVSAARPVPFHLWHHRLGHEKAFSRSPYTEAYPRNESGHVLVRGERFLGRVQAYHPAGT